MRSKFTNALRRLMNLRERSNFDTPEMFILLGVVITSGASLLLQVIGAGAAGPNLRHWAIDWLRDFSTDLAGGGLTFIFIKWLWTRRERLGPSPHQTRAIILEGEEDIEILEKPVKQQLDLQDLKTAPSTESRQRIIDQAKRANALGHAQLANMDLHGADLSQANLHHSDFTKANLRGAHLNATDLTHAHFFMAQLIEADFSDANLTEANLEHAFVSGACFERSILTRARIKTTLWGNNLRNATLLETDLRSAELFRTDLTGADLSGALFDGARISPDTILPDGSHWNKSSDIRRFTNSTYQDYWRSDDPNSPAFRNAT